jgi:hypothetical protein
MLRNLIPSGAIVGLCVAIYATSLNVPPSQLPLTAVPVGLEPPPSIMHVEWVKPAAPPPAASEKEPCGGCAQQKEALAISAEPTTPKSIEHAHESKSAHAAPRALPKTVHTSTAWQQRLPRQYSAHNSTEEPAPVRQQLRSAQAALAEGNPELARGLLESAETAMVFEPSGSRQSHTASATAQITQALRGLNSGDRAVALQYVGRALATVESGL